jgi:hypothetical protein
MRPHMHNREFEVFSRHYASADSIIEFGCGGSTVFGVQETKATIRSVESDRDWIAKLRDLPAMAEAERTNRLEILHADIGATKEWGHPADPSTKEKWPIYSNLPWPAEPSLVFVDGRFRLACILNAILNVRPDTIIMVHDFWNRPAYHAALLFLDEVESIETLGVFKPRSIFDRERVQAMKTAAEFVSD